MPPRGNPSPTLTLPAAALFATALLLTLVRAAPAQTPTLPQVRNDRARLTVTGDTVDAHDGRVARFGDRYYWYGTQYGRTSGFTRANRYVVYSAASLAGPWTAHGPILPAAPSGVYYRPHVIRDAARDRYVLWYNWYPRLWTGRFGVAVSDSPTGPFRIVDDDVQVRHSGLGVGDFNLFVDRDGAGYLMYNTIEGHRLSVERLRDDYLASTLDNGGFVADHCEAGSVFRRDSTYYLLTDYTCCFCTQGSGARVYTAAAPLGPYALRQNINRYPGTAAPRLTDGDERPTVYRALARSPEADTFPAVELALAAETALGTLTAVQYSGNRRGQCGDTLAARTHEPRVAARFRLEARVAGTWQPLSPEQQPDTQRTSLTSRVTVDLAGVHADGLRLHLEDAYPYEAVQLVELRLTDAAGALLGAREGAHAYVLDVDPQHTPPIVPAQQTYMMPLEVDGRTEYLWMGDLWGSAPDDVKGHDQQYWSSPLEFYPNGLIRPLRYEAVWGGGRE